MGRGGGRATRVFTQGDARTQGDASTWYKGSRATVQRERGGAPASAHFGGSRPTRRPHDCWYARRYPPVKPTKPAAYIVGTGIFGLMPAEVALIAGLGELSADLDFLKQVTAKRAARTGSITVWQRKNGGGNPRRPVHEREVRHCVVVGQEGEGTCTSAMPRAEKNPPSRPAHTAMRARPGRRTPDAALRSRGGTYRRPRSWGFV